MADEWYDQFFEQSAENQRKFVADSVRLDDIMRDGTAYVGDWVSEQLDEFFAANGRPRQKAGSTEELDGTGIGGESSVTSSDAEGAA